MAVHSAAVASCPVAAGATRAAPHSGHCCPAPPGHGKAARFRAAQVATHRADSAVSDGARAEEAAAAESVWVAAGRGDADVGVEPAAAWAAAVDAAKDCVGGTRVVPCSTDPSSPLR